MAAKKATAGKKLNPLYNTSSLIKNVGDAMKKATAKKPAKKK